MITEKEKRMRAGDWAYIVESTTIEVARPGMPRYFCSLKDSRGLYHHGYGDTEDQAENNARNHFYEIYNS